MSRLRVILSVALVALMSVVTITACRTAPLSTPTAQKIAKLISSDKSSLSEASSSSSEASSAAISSSSEASAAPSATAPSTTQPVAAIVPPPKPASSAVAQPTVQAKAVAVSPPQASSTPSPAAQLTAPTSAWADTGLSGISKVYEYGKTTLDTQKQTIYDQIVQGVTNMNTQITIPTSLTPPEMETIYRYCMQDHAGIFYVSSAEMSYSYYMSSNTSVYLSYTFQLTYTYSSGEVQAMRAQMAAGAAQMLDKAKASLTTAGKDASNTLNMESALNDALIEDISYDMTEYNYGTRPISHQAYGAFANKTAVCDGYSRALKLLLDSQGIKSLLIEGTAVTSGGSGGHAWNMAQINGTWYYLDATFDDNGNTSSPDYFNFTSKSNHILGTFNADDPFAVSSENYAVMPGVG